MTTDPADTGPADTGRAPLSASALTGAVVRPGGLWHSVTVVEQTGSTNADLLEQAAAGAAEGSVLVAEQQTAGRGRLGRSWQSPAGASLMFSMLLRPDAVPAGRRGWLPLLTGVAVAAAIRSGTGLRVGLKWPNDVLAGGRKLAGILAEQAGQAIVVGVGLNVSASRAELPVDTATSLLLEQAAGTGRQRLLTGMLAEFERRYLAWAGSDSAGDPEVSGLRAAYRQDCVTLGQPVRAELPGGAAVTGTALDIDAEGRLLLATGGETRAISAGDIVHLR